MFETLTFLNLFHIWQLLYHYHFQVGNIPSLFLVCCLLDSKM